MATREGWLGWDDYAPFYDWENARTLGRRDVAFWRRFAAKVDGPVLELGCGTGRISLPVVRAGVELVGVDRSAAMLARLRARQRKASPGQGGRSGGRAPATRSRGHLRVARGDIRALPFAAGSFAAVIAPYGVMQSLLRDRDLRATLQSVAGVLRPEGLLAIDLVPDVPNWREYRNRVQLRGRAAGGVHLTLVESVRQDRRRRLTTFEQRYVERRAGRTAERVFELTFRTLSVREMAGRLEAAGFVVDAVLGDYHGRDWDERADVWILMAHRG